MVKEFSSNWFTGRSALVKCVAFLLIALIVVLVALFLNLVLRQDEPTCKSDHCIRVSAEKMRSIDQSVDPCDDFHAFVCGNLMKNFTEAELPPVSGQLNALIEEPMNYDDPQPFLMQKSFYKSCVNLAAIEIDQEETILAFFDRLGYWPVLRGAYWNASSYDWIDFIIKSRNLGLDFEWFLEFKLIENNYTRTNLLMIDIPSYLKPEEAALLHARKVLFTDVANFLGAPKEISHYETAKTIDFEDELGQLAEKHRHERVRNESPARLTIREIQEWWPSIPWIELINNVTGIRVMDYDYVIFDIQDYVKDLHRLILGTPKRIQVDFMMWKLVESLWPYLSRPIREKFETYNQDIFGKEPEFNRQRFCLNQSRIEFPLVAESVYIRKHVTEGKKQAVKEMIGFIRKQFVTLLEDASWMNRESRRRALSKVLNLSFMIGGPDEVFDKSRFYEQLGLHRFVYASHSIIEMLTERKIRLFSQRFGLIDPTAMNSRADIDHRAVNITNFSIIHNNTVVIPAALLQDTFYNPQLPNYLNYATLGKTLAREIFEHLASENDTSYTWWTQDSFNDLIRCLLKESSNFPNPEFKRSRSFKKNLADFVAIDVAYEAYREWARIQPEELMLPGLKFAPNQMFWMHASRNACGVPYTRHDRDNSRFKVVAPLRNSRNFFREYGCQDGSRMNPRKKCRVL